MFVCVSHAAHYLCVCVWWVVVGGSVRVCLCVFSVNLCVPVYVCVCKKDNLSPFVPSAVWPTLRVCVCVCCYFTVGGSFWSMCVCDWLKKNIKKEKKIEKCVWTSEKNKITAQKQSSPKTINENWVINWLIMLLVSICLKIPQRQWSDNNPPTISW